MANRKAKTERRIEKDLIGILVFLVFLIVAFFIAGYIFKNLNQFEHAGLTFTKENFGELPVFHYYYNFKAPVTGQIIKYNLYLRNDPRENDIPITGDKIKFSFGRPLYITMDATDLVECRRSNLAIATISSFLTDNQLDVRSGTTDLIEAAVFGDNKIKDYITCENKPNNVVIEFSRGDNTEIIIDGICHHIIIGPDCDILEAVENYEVQSILDAKEV